MAGLEIALWILVFLMGFAAVGLVVYVSYLVSRAVARWWSV